MHGIHKYSHGAKLINVFITATKLHSCLSITKKKKPSKKHPISVQRPGGCHVSALLLPAAEVHISVALQQRSRRREKERIKQIIKASTIKELWRKT